MSVIQNSSLASYKKLIAEGADIRQEDNQSTFNIGLLNMMPDAALEPTERQFIRLLARCDALIKVYMFSIDGLDRSSLGEFHIGANYYKFNDLIRLQEQEQLHALIISGSNVPRGEMSKAAFWVGLTAVFSWLREHSIPTLFTCLATHAALEFFYQQKRQPLAEKCWGVFKHHSTSKHPLLKELAKIIYVPHSRFNAITPEQFTKANIKPLIKSDEAGIHLAVCNQYPFTFFQGHPEYDAISLLKEYKREVISFSHRQFPDYPVVPANYLNADAIKSLTEFKDFLCSQNKSEQRMAIEEKFPEETIAKSIKNRWFDSGSRVFNNWVNSLKET